MMSYLRRNIHGILALAAAAALAGPVVGAAAGAAAAETIVCEGVLGNSGGQGADLVRFADGKPARGMGVAHDRFGSLWDRAGEGVLNRYAPDGRLLAQYRIPKGGDDRDQLTLVGDRLVLQIDGRLFTLPVDAPAGAEAAPMKRESTCLSFGSVGGRFASATKEAVFLVTPAGEAQQVLALAGADAVELGPDGALYVVIKGKMSKVVDGKAVADGWPRAAPGSRPQLLDGRWYGHAWHGTIRRYGADMEPSPGVILGGASGSFIGHLDQNTEVWSGRGLAKIGPNLFAVSGMGGIVHLMEWSEERQQMRLIRRLGAVPQAGGIGLDRDGRVWWFAGAWAWTDRPDVPMEFGVNAPEGEGVGQVVMLPGDEMVAAGRLWGQPGFYHGKLSTEVVAQRVEKGCSLRPGSVAAAVYADGGKLTFLAVDKAGAAQAFVIDPNGAYRGEAGPVALKPATPAKEWTSLAMAGPGVLLGAADGYIIEMRRDGKDWKESRRWNSWGPGPTESFGPRIHIAADAGRLWVADRERHRVLAFALDTGKPLAAFGKAGEKGTDMASLAFPETLAARGTRAVVFDSGNQRLIKLSLK